MLTADPLIRYLRRPSKARLARVVHEYHGFVWEVAFRLTGDRGDASDICQDVFLKLLLDPPSGETVDVPRGYLAWKVLGRARFLRRGAERRKRREQMLAKRVVESQTSDDEAELIAKTVSELPDDLRTVVELHHLGEFPVRRVAETLGMSERAVYLRLEKARGILKKRLAPLVPSTLLLGAIPDRTMAAPSAGLLSQLLRIVEEGSVLAGASAPVAAGAMIGGSLMAKKVGLSSACLIVLLGLVWHFSGGLFPWSTSDDARDAPRPDDKTVLEEQAPAAQTGTQRTTANKQSPPHESDSLGDQPGAETEEVVLAGYTLDRSDRPIAGTRVGLLEAEGQCENSAYSFRGLRTIFPRARGSLEELTPAGLIRIAANVSDRDGYFEFRLRRSSGTYHFRCVGPERLSYHLGGPFSLSDSPVRLRLQPAHELAGLIRDAGSETRVVGAIVDLIEEDTATRKEDWGHIGERGRARRISDVDGMFHFDLLPPGSYRLEVLHSEYPGVVREVVELPVEADPFIVTLTSSEGGVVISGRVRDAIAGFGIGGAEIVDFGKYRVTSAPSGEYRMHLEEKDVKYGKHFTVRAPGYGMLTKYFHGRMVSQEWDIALQPARRLTCHVISESEQSVSGAKVFVRAKLVTPDGRSNSYHSYCQVTDDDGTCVFKDLPAIENVDLFGFHPTLSTLTLFEGHSLTLFEGRRVEAESLC